MATKLYNRSLYKRLRRILWDRSNHGFTLLELLISILIAGFVVSGLLYLAVELLRVDRRELSLDQTQRDMQRALDYISDDMREAVYVYSSPATSVVSQLTDLPTGAEPVIAFWRPNAIENFPTNCASFPSTPTDQEDECEVLKIRQAAYSLVVYLLLENDGASPEWLGASRILRYELPKYSSIANLTRSTGYNDPTSPGIGFSNWTRDGASTDGNTAVLVDFVDDPDSNLNRTPLSDASGPCKDSYGTNYQVVPSTTTTTTDNSFFACVRNPNSDATDEEGNDSQDVYIFVRGNAIDGAKGVVTSFSEDSALPTIETRVLVRGVLDKNPVN